MHPICRRDQQPDCNSSSVTSGTASVSVNTTAPTYGAMALPETRTRKVWPVASGEAIFALLILAWVPRAQGKVEVDSTDGGGNRGVGEPCGMWWGKQFEHHNRARKFRYDCWSLRDYSDWNGQRPVQIHRHHYTFSDS